MDCLLSMLPKLFFPADNDFSPNQEQYSYSHSADLLLACDLRNVSVKTGAGIPQTIIHINAVSFFIFGILLLLNLENSIIFLILKPAVPQPAQTVSRVQALNWRYATNL
ncbi:MAG: hypothetical protein ACOCWD_03905 [Tangfeifania sp.]